MSIFSRFGMGSHKNQALVSIGSMTTKVVAGGAANADIAVAGIKAGDVIQACIENAAGTLTDRTAEAVALTDGNIQLTTTSTAGDQLMVTYFPGSK